MMYSTIVSNILLIAFINLNADGVLAVDIFKFESRQPRHQTESSGQLSVSVHEKRSTNSYNLRCPRQEYIHPCDCLELDKRLDSELEGSGSMESGETATTSVPLSDMSADEPIHPDLIETVAFCKNIRNVQVLTDAIKGFQGHRINYFVLDGCKLPPFPNSIFNGVNILWMEILNSTLQFHENYFNTKQSCP